MTADLVISAVLNGVNLDDPSQGYELQAETRSTFNQQWRKQTVSNAYVEGEFDVLAVRSNVVEPVNVWIEAVSPSDFAKKLLFLESSISQPHFTLTWITGNLQEVWDCTYSEYTLETNQSYQIALIGLVRMQITRRPSVTRTFSDGSVLVS